MLLSRCGTAANRTLPRGKRPASQTSEQDNEKLDELAEEAVRSDAQDNQSSGDDLQAAKEEKKKELTQRPYSIVKVNWPESIFFEPVHTLDHTAIKININHRFYKDVFEPLCGSIETMDDESDGGVDSEDKGRARDAFMLLLLAYAKAESLLKSGDESEDEQLSNLLSNLRAEWALALGTALRQLKDDA